MEIHFENPKELIPYARNNKKHSAEQIQHIADSIEKFWFIQPIVVDVEKVIIIGHARREAAIKLKIKSVPILMKADLTEHQTQRLRLLDNRLSDLGEYDIDNVLAEIDDLGDSDLKALFSNLYPASEEEEDTGGAGDGTETPNQLQDMVIVVTQEQRELIEKALEVAKKIPFTDNENCNANGNALFVICRAFISQ